MIQKNIVFVGGIHGVGKTTLCRSVSNELGVIHLTASEILSWSEDQNKKQVNDILEMQRRLISGLERFCKDDRLYLLDGHYCLLDQAGNITEIPIEIFEQINPKLLVLINGDLESIQARLQERDQQRYNMDMLIKFKKTEAEHAQKVASKLGNDLYMVQNTDRESLKSVLKGLTQTK